jgi:hypothetical protein
LEERGTVSAARDGELRRLRSSDELAREMRRHLAGIAPETPPRSRFERLARRWPEALASVAIAAGLWLVRVPGSDVVEVERHASVRVEGLPDGYEVESIDPPEVAVKLSGTRWDLFRSRGQPVVVRIDALMVQFGRRTFPLSASQVEHPPDVEPVEVDPANVKLSLRRKAPEAASP